MNDDILKGNWKELKGKVKAKWGELTDDDVQEVEGNRDRLVGKLQQKYGETRDEAAKRDNDFIDDVERKLDR